MAGVGLGRPGGAGTRSCKFGWAAGAVLTAGWVLYGTPVVGKGTAGCEHCAGVRSSQEHSCIAAEDPRHARIACSAVGIGMVGLTRGVLCPCLEAGMPMNKAGDLPRAPCSLTCASQGLHNKNNVHVIYTV